MHRCVHLTLLLAAALALLAVPIASGASPDLVVSQVYAGGGNSGATYANDFVELFNRGSSTVDLSGLVAAIRDGLRHELAGDRPRRLARARSPLPRRPRLRRRERHSTACGRRDRHIEPRGLRRQGRARARRRCALLRSDGRELQHGRGRPRPRRLRIGDRLRGRRRPRALEHCGGVPRLERLRRHRRERHRLHDRHSGAANHCRRRRRRAAERPSGRLRLGRGQRRTGPAVDALDRTREADARASATSHPATRPRLSPTASPSRARTVPATRSAHTGARSRPPTSRSGSPRRPRPRGSSARRWRGGARAALPIAPAADLLVGTTAAPSAASGDSWPTSLAFTSPLPSLASGHYTATVTFTVIAR